MSSNEYTPSDIEPKWQAVWEKTKPFKTDPKPGAKKLYILDMFPYPSGSGLHIGHPLGYTATDIYSRFKRMQGFSVLHPMGYDAFGLPAEQHAVATGEHPSLITEQNCDRFTAQMKKIGLSYDWDREIKSCTEDYYQWTQWIFLKLYNSWFDPKTNKAKPITELPIPAEISKKGEAAILSYQAEYRLAYYADAMVNWCPELGTVLANEEVIDGKSERGGFDVIRKPMKQWILRITSYADRLIDELEEVNWPEAIKEQQRNWIGKKFGAEINFKVSDRDDVLVAFTTRVDTLFGVTFFVISPEHPIVSSITKPQFQKSVEEYCEKARRMSEMDRTLDNRKKTGVFTGSYVINPITSEEVPLYIGDYVLMSYGTGSVMGVPAHDDRDFEFARLFNIPVRPVLAPKEENSQLAKIIEGEVTWTEPGFMLPSSFKAAKELGLEGISNETAKEKILGWLDKNSLGKKVVNYKLRDWLFSRQRYWGEPIPVIHWEDGTSTAVDESELPLKLPPLEDYKPSDGGESPLAKATEWLKVTCKKTGKKGRRETNTMPQWAGSCWYYLRFIDPKNASAGWDKELEKAWMPVDLYVGGAEHAVLHLLYARFWHKVLYDLGYVSTKEPFQRLFNQGMVLSYAYKDKRGALIPVDEVKENDNGEPVNIKTGEVLEQITAKMSKSLRNVINPEEVISQYGADTLRLYLMFMGPLDAARIWDSKAISGTHRFLRRSFTWVSGEITKVGVDSQKALIALHKLVKRVGEFTHDLKFNTGIAACMEFLNEISEETVSKQTLQTYVKVLSPYAPHLAEELWEKLGGKDSVSKQAWPDYDPSFLVSDQATVVIQINGKKRATIEVRVDIDEPSLKSIVEKTLHGTEHALVGSERFMTVFQPGTKIPKLVNIVKGK